MPGLAIPEIARDLADWLKAHGSKNVGAEIELLCPFHADEHPSCHFNPEKGTFVCRSCGTSGGVLKIGAALRDRGYEIPRVGVADAPSKIVTSDAVDEAHHRLLASNDAMKFLAEKRFITREVVAKFRLGLGVAEEMEFIYPIRHNGSLFPSSRIYRPSRPKEKRRWWKPAFSKVSKDLKAPLFGVVEAEAIDSTRIILCEGEDKALALHGWGLPAVALTTGAGNWPARWFPHFKGKEATFIPDMDPAGQAAIDKFIVFAKRAAVKGYRIVKLPLPGTPGEKDITDWIRSGGTKDALAGLTMAAELVEVGEGEPPPAQPPAEGGGHGPGPDRDGLTDWGNAQRFVRLHGDRMRYSWEWGKWLVWTGKLWDHKRDDLLWQYAKSVALDIHEEAARRGARAMQEPDPVRRQQLMDAAENVKKWAQTTEKADRLRSMIMLAQSEPGVRITTEELDRNSFLLNFQNCTVDLKTGESHNHRQSDFITKISPVNWNPGATCPRWLQFLDEITGGNKSLSSYLQRVAGYGITADVSEQVLFFFYGGGANGKSTFLETIMAVLGSSYAMEAAPGILIEKEHDSHPTEIADLFGLRFVTTIEVGEGKRMAEVLVKQLTGCDTLKARRMREDFWSFRPTHKIFLAANHKPDIEGTDYAIWRRIRLVPFNEKFEGERRDLKLPEKLALEAEGIATWLVQGAALWSMIGLSDPKEVLAATDEYRSEMDVLAEFIEDRCIRGQFNKVSSSHLYEKYLTWHKRVQGGFPLTQTAFGRRLAERGFRRDRTNKGVFWCGISISESDEEAAENSFFGKG